MWRIDNPTALPAIPAAGPPGAPGFFTDGNPAAGLEATIVDGWWLNMLQEEVLTVITSVGIAPSKTSYTQLYDAIQAIAFGNNPDLSGYLPLSGGVLSGPGNLVVSGGLNVGLGIIASGGIRYLQTSNYHSFSWDSTTVHAWVDATDIGSLVTANYPGSVVLAGNFNCGNIGAASISGTYLGSTGDGYVAGGLTTGSIATGSLSCGTIWGAAGSFTGDVYAAGTLIGILGNISGQLSVGGNIICHAEVHGGNSNFGTVSAVSFSTAGAVVGGTIQAAAGLYGATANISGRADVGYISSNSGGIVGGAGVAGDTFAVGISAVGTAYCAFFGVRHWPIGCNQAGDFVINEVTNTRHTIYAQSGIEQTYNSTYLKPDGGGFTNSNSDVRVKKDIIDYAHGLAEIMQLRPVDFAYNGRAGTIDDGSRHIGLIVNDVAQVMPEMIVLGVSRQLAEGEDDLADMLSLNTSALQFALVNAVKELAGRVEALEGRPRPA